MKEETWTLSHPPEVALLIACSLPPSRFTAARMLSLAVSMDWDKLWELAAYHRVLLLLLQRLREYGSTMVPENFMIELEKQSRANATRNLHLTGELIALVNAFKSAEIPVLPHKGPLLAQSIYGDLNLRQIADLDLLVHPSDLQRAIAVLAKHDYRPAAALAWLSPAALLRWTGEISYNSSHGTSVDLHWRLTPSHYPVQLDPQILWRSCTTIKIGGSDLPALEPEALLLLLAVHGAKHCWESLGWLADVAWLVDSPSEFDWQHAMNLAQEARCQSPLLLAAALVESLFGAELPRWMSERILQDPAIDRLKQRVLSRLDQELLESPQSPELFSFSALLARSRWDSLRHLFGSLLYPTEIDWKTRRLPERLFWLYTPRRIVRLARKYLRR